MRQIMTQRSLFPQPKFASEDPCERKHGGNEVSAEAFESGKQDHEKDRQAILRHLRASNGLTSKQIALKLDKPLHHISPRLTELLQDGLIRDSGRRLDKCRVLEAVG